MNCPTLQSLRLLLECLLTPIRSFRSRYTFLKPISSLGLARYRPSALPVRGFTELVGFYMGLLITYPWTRVPYLAAIRSLDATYRYN